MFNSRETGQNRTAHGAVHNNCARVPCFPVSRPFTSVTSYTGLWLFGSFLSSVFRFPCAIPNTVPAPFRTRFALLLLSIAPADSFPFRVRRWCPVPVLFMLDSIRISPEVLLTPALSLQAAPVSFAPLLLLYLCPCSCGLMRYAATRGAGSLILCYSCRSLSVLSMSGSSGGREQNRFLLRLTPTGAGRRVPPAVLLSVFERTTAKV